MFDQPHHGGRLIEAARRWKRPVQDWLDLSTGINPIGWPVPTVPAWAWQRLPEPDDGLEARIRTWTGAPDHARCVAVPGTQAAIMALPRLRSPGRVGVPVPGYREHGYWWQQSGHQVEGLTEARLDQSDEDWLDRLDVLVCINPNNPTGQSIPRDKLLRWHRRLSERGGWLIVDEAFWDGQPGTSMASDAGAPGLVILHSLGKFFGLAGARAGSVTTHDDIARSLEDELGPWPVSGPARFIMARALEDKAWQRAARDRLERDSLRLAQMLIDAGLPSGTGTTLFRYVQTERARAMSETLASLGILVRVFDRPSALRFGLPGDESDWDRLAHALPELAIHIDQRVSE